MLPLVWAAFTAQTADSATAARYTRALQAVDDSLSSVRSAAANFRADLATASPALVLARSARMSARCAGARAALDTLQASLGTARSPRAASQQALRSEATQLARALERCVREWNADPRVAVPDSLRAWGPFRIEQLENQMRRYALRARAFRNRAGTR